MKTLNNIRIIGIDHGYGNIKTANTITPTGVIPSTIRPAFGSNILRCDGMYYSCGEGHKAFVSDKSGDNDYYCSRSWARQRNSGAPDFPRQMFTLRLDSR